MKRCLVCQENLDNKRWVEALMTMLGTHYYREPAAPPLVGSTFNLVLPSNIW